MIPCIPLLLSALHAASITLVSGGSGSAARIQAAVDACPSTGCVIQLPDARYEMENQVWVVGKSDISFVGTGSERPVLTWADSLLSPTGDSIAPLLRLRPPEGGNRPRLQAGWLMWPNKGTVGPGTLSDSANPWAREGFMHNGMFLVKESRRIAFRHLHLRGGKSVAFAVRGVWGGRWDLYHGSVGVSLLRSRAVDVVDCDIERFWSGLYLNNRNLSCAPWRGTEESPIAADSAWASCGAMGGHLIERSRIHGSWHAVYSESEWDQGSVIRENLAWNNGNQAKMNPSTTIASTAATNGYQAYGGFLVIKDVIAAAHVVSHNTVIDNTLPYGHDGYRAGCTALWSDNVLRVPDSLGTLRTGILWNHCFEGATRPHLWNSTFLHSKNAVETRVGTVFVTDSTYGIKGTKSVPIDTVPGIVKGGRLLVIGTDTFSVLSESRPDTTWCGSGCWVSLPSVMNITQDWSVPPMLRAIQGGWWKAPLPDLDGVIRPRRVWQNMFSDSVGLVNTARTAPAIAKGYELLHCRNCSFASMDSSRPDFLLPKRRPDDGGPFERGYRRGLRGALDAEGRLGGHVPVRVRATGVPRRTDGSHLGLPLVFHSESGPIDRMVVVRSEIRSFFVGSGSSSSPAFMSEKVIDSLTHGSSINPSAALLEIPFQPSASDTLVQIDLWFAGISGSDTLDATPMSWVWAKGMTATPAIPVGISNGVRPLTRYDVASSILQWHGHSEHLDLISPSGRRLRLPASCSQQSCRANLSTLPSGVWTPVLPGARPIPRL